MEPVTLRNPSSSSYDYAVYSCALGPDGKLLASGTYGYGVQLWDVETRSCVATLCLTGSTIVSCAFSPNGKLLASASDETVNIWNVGTRACVATLSMFRTGVISCVFSSDGMLTCHFSDNTAETWDVKTRKRVAHTGSAYSGVLSPDGKLRASATSDGMVKLCNVETGSCVATLTGHTRVVRSCAFSPDGKLLASGGDDKTVKIWDVDKCLTAAAHAQAVTDWLTTHDLAHHARGIFNQLGVTRMRDLLQLKASDLKAIEKRTTKAGTVYEAFKVAEINRFVSAVKLLGAAKTAPVAAGAAAGDADARSAYSDGERTTSFQPRPFPGVGALVNQMDGHGEALATMHMRWLGFADAIPSGCVAAGEFPTTWDDLLAKAVAYVRSKDGGVDVTANDAVAQVKSKFRNATSRAEVAQLVGDTSLVQHVGKRRIFYAVSYANGVSQYADEVGMALFTFTAEGVVSPHNQAAEQLLAGAAAPQPPPSSRKRARAVAPDKTRWATWSKAEVEQFLDASGFEHYTPCFAMVDGADLKDLSADDLAGLPPPAISAFVAKKMLAAFAALCV